VGKASFDQDSLAMPTSATNASAVTTNARSGCIRTALAPQLQSVRNRTLANTELRLSTSGGSG
jgi:hypothetical protein